MTEKKEILASRLSKVAPPKRETLMAFLPEPLPTDPGLSSHEERSFSLEELFKKIDESWYMPYLKGLNEKDRAFFLSSLKEEKYRFNPKQKQFVLNLLGKEVFKDDLPIPIYYVRNDPLLPIAKADRESLYRFIFYLGLFDVSLEIKKIIRSSIFLQLEESLTKEEIEFLKGIDQIEPKMHFQEMGLSNWNGEKESFRKIVFERGLNRLAKAFSQSEPGLVWYLVHTLSRTDAEKLRSFLVTTKKSPLLQALARQVLETWEKLCTAFHL